MWVITTLFDGPDIDKLDIPQKPKLLKPNKTYVLARWNQDLNVNAKRISSKQHCEFIVGPHTVDDAGNLSARPTLELVSRVKKGKGITVTRADGTIEVLGTDERLFLYPNDTVAIMSKVPAIVTWRPVVVVGKEISLLGACAALGIKLLPAPHKDATHHLLSHYAANMLTAGSLVAACILVKPEWLREVIRVGTLPASDDESLEAQYALPLESKYRPAFSPSLLPEQKQFALWQPTEARLKLFHAYRFVCLQEKTRESDGELRDTIRLGEGEVDSFDVSFGVAKFRVAVTRSQNKEGKTTVLIGDADQLQLAVGKETWSLYVAEARKFGLQILPPSKIVQAVLEANVDVLTSNVKEEQREESPLPEMVANTMEQEPTMAPEPPKPVEVEQPPEPQEPEPEPEPAPAPRRRLVRRVTSRAPSTEPSIPPTFPATPAVENTETVIRPRKALTRRVVHATPIITGLPDDPSVVLDEPPKPDKPTSSSKVPPTPGRNPRLKRRVVSGGDAPKVDDGLVTGLTGGLLAAKRRNETDNNAEPPLKKFKALFESTNPNGSGADTFEIMNSVPIDSMSQIPGQSGMSEGQTQTQTQTQTPSQLGMPPPGQGPPSRFARPTESTLEVLREEEEETTQSVLGAKRAAEGDAGRDMEDGGVPPVAKKRAIENVNAVARDTAARGTATTSKTPAATTTAAAATATKGAPAGKPDKDTAFLKAVASSKRGKKTEDEFDKEFNRLRISKPVLDEKEDDREAEWKVLADFGDDSGLRGNFMTIVEMDVPVRERQDVQRCRNVNPEWEGKPNFKKFKKKVVHSKAKVDVFLADTVDYGMGPGYWKGGESQSQSQGGNPTQASMFGSQSQSQINIAAGKRAETQPLMDSDDEMPLPRSRRAPSSRAGSVRPSRAGSAAPQKKTTARSTTKASATKGKKSGAALFLDSEDEIKEEDENDIEMIDDEPETMTLHSSAEPAKAPSRRTVGSRSTAAAGATQGTSRTTKAASKAKKAAPIIVEDDSDDDAVFKGF